MKSRSIIFLFILLLATSCVEEVSGSFVGDDVLVVNCVLKDSDVQDCRISFLNDESDARISQAKITLIDLDESRSMRFSHEAGGVYNVGCQPQGGHRYRLEIDLPDYEHVSAETCFPEIPVIYVNYSNVTHFRFGEVDGPVYIWMSARNAGGKIAPYIITSCYTEDDFNITDCRVSDYYEFGDDALSGILSTPINEFLSVEQQNLMRESDYIYPDESIVRSIADRLISSCFHDRFVRIPFPSDYDNGLYKNASRDFSVLLPGGARLSYPIIQTDVVSKEYDLYLRDALKEGMKTDTDLHAIYDRTNPYTNILHGIGIFGAYRVKKVYEWTQFYVLKGPFYATE